MTSYEDEYDDEEDPPVSQAKVLSLRVDGPARGVSFGFLAMLPLFVAYELAGPGEPGHPRAVAEAMLFSPFTRLGAPDVVLARRLILAVLTIAALVSFYLQVRREHGAALGPRFARTLIEGALGGIIGVVVLHSVVGVGVGILVGCAAGAFAASGDLTLAPVAASALALWWAGFAPHRR